MTNPRRVEVGREGWGREKPGGEGSGGVSSSGPKAPHSERIESVYRGGLKDRPAGPQQRVLVCVEPYNSLELQEDGIFLVH